MIDKNAYEALKSIVGPEYITDDDLICRAYFSGGYGVDSYQDKGLVRPACVVLPGDTEEVQRIVKAANRYKVPLVPASAFWAVLCTPRRPDMVLVDLKRMNRMEIDEKNMYALVEPYVIYSQLQAEAFKRGLYALVPGGGGQVSVVANSIFCSMSPLAYRFGWPTRRLAGVEWVLPTGEILRLGSSTFAKEYFWCEGPGPDLRGMLRGALGWCGGLGIVTKVAFKLHPFVPESPESMGISPHSTLKLPEDRMRWYNITFPSLERLIEAIYKINKAEIGAAVTSVPNLWRYRAKAESREHFWEMWPKAEKEIKKAQRILRVLLIGYTSEKQLEYEERVLMDIVAESEGSPRRTRQTDESWLKNSDAVGMWWVSGGYISMKGNIDTLEHAIQSGKAGAELAKDFAPPLVEEYGEIGWIQSVDFGHGAYLEFLINFDPDDDYQTADQCAIASYKQDIAQRRYNMFPVMGYGPVGLSGPAYDNYHLMLSKVKRTFDPNNISNPPRPLDVDEAIEKHCPWIEKDWKTIKL